jgi:hypothetical protein
MHNDSETDLDQYLQTSLTQTIVCQIVLLLLASAPVFQTDTLVGPFRVSNSTQDIEAPIA